MDAVFTIHDWQDGPLLGIAAYGDETCIYERIFSEEQDAYLDQYSLTPVSGEQRRRILADWEKWLHWMACGPSPACAEEWRKCGTPPDLKRMAEQSPDCQKYRKRAEFHGTFPKNFSSEIKNFYVVWKSV